MLANSEVRKHVHVYGRMCFADSREPIRLVF